MRNFRQLLLSTFVVTSMLAIGAPADAGRSGPNSARPSATSQRANQQRQRQRTRGQRTTQQRNNASSQGAGLKDKVHVAAVKARVNHWKNVVKNGEADSSGQLNFYAAGAELISTRGVKQTEVRGVAYGTGNDHSQRIKVTGVKNGKWSGHLVGWVSTHDLASMSWSQYASAVKNRVSNDRIMVSYDHGPGTAKKVLVKGLKGGEATSVPLKDVPLNPNGVTRIIYDRTDASGNRGGSSDAYVGRIVEITQ